MPAGGMMIAAGIGIGANIIGSIASSGDRDAAMAAYRAALDEISRLGAPPDLAREIILKKFEQEGVLTPELEESVTLDAPKIASLKEDPTLRKAQTSALELIGERARTGFSAEDRSALAQIQLQQARDTEAKRRQILQSFQERGLGGAGSELAAQLQAASAGSAQAGEEGLKLQAQAAQSALQAAAQYGQLGTQVRGQEFDIARTKAGALDQAAMARFNAEQARQQRNVATRMGVQQQNLATRQRIADQNVAAANAELQRQREGEAERYRLGLQRGQIMMGGQQAIGQQYAQRADATAQAWSNIGQGASTIAANYKAPSGASKMSTQKIEQDAVDSAGDPLKWQNGP